MAVDRIASSPRRAARSGRLGRSLRPLVGRMLFWQAVSVAVVLLAWEVAGRVPINVAFPPFSDVFVAFVALVADGSLPVALLITLQPLALGLVISTALGVGLGVLMGLRGDVAWFATPLFVVMQAAPMAALIPLITFVYGIGLTSKVLAVCMLALPVIVLNAYKAVRNVSPSLRMMGRSFRATRLQEAVKIVLPAASPMIFAGLRLGIAAGFVGAVLAELLITPTGVGDLITFYRSIAGYAEMYATIATIILFAAVTVGLMQRLEATLFRPEMRALRS